jgi:hypothetical protein
VRAQPGAGGDTSLQAAQAAVTAVGRRMSERLRGRSAVSLASIVGTSGAAGASGASAGSGAAGGSGVNSNSNTTANPPGVDAEGGGSGQVQGLASRALQRQRERESAWATRESQRQRERRHPAYRPTRYTHVPKTCPICRGRVSARPAEVWAIKDMVGSVVKSGVVELPATSSDSNEEEGTCLFCLL